MGKYDDIIDLPHYESSTRPRMSMLARAAQFSPFAALTGYEDAVEETARLTQNQIELTEDRKLEIDERLRKLCEMPDFEKIKVILTYFVPDSRKAGGEYVTRAVSLKRIDEYEMELVLCDKTRIPISTIRDISIE